jgi:hypothetical protein
MKLNEFNWFQIASIHVEYMKLNAHDCRVIKIISNDLACVWRMLNSLNHLKSTIICSIDFRWIQGITCEHTWIEVIPSDLKSVRMTSNETKWGQVTPSGLTIISSDAKEGKWDQVSSVDFKWFKYVQVTSNDFRWVQKFPSEFKWATPLSPQSFYSTWVCSISTCTEREIYILAIGGCGEGGCL